jgi:hypothetical protein
MNEMNREHLFNIAGVLTAGALQKEWKTNMLSPQGVLKP